MINQPEGQSAELRQFNGVIDTDNPLKDVVPGNYLELRNCRNSTTNRVEKMKGFQLINNQYQYLGENKCIGYHEDLQHDSIIYFVWNSFENHGIFRYYRNRANQPYGEIEKIIQINFPQLYTSNNPNALNFDPDYLITGTALVDNNFFWNEYNNSPRCIDIDRANETNKHRQFNICFNKTNFNIATTYTINVYAPANPVPVFTNTWAAAAAANTTYQQRVDAFVAVMKIIPDVPFEITSCINDVMITMTLEGRYFVEVLETTAVLANQNISLVVPNNFYPDSDLAIPSSYSLFRNDLIERMRPVPFIEPTVVYGTDVTRKINLVKDKVFQFRCLYRYFDYTQSSWGAISNIAIPSHNCSDNNYGDNDNYINVDFSDPRLENPALISIIKSVDLAVREHNTGVWKLVKTFLQYEIAGIGQANFKFYNDGNYAAIDQAETTLPYYSVPLNAQSLEIVDDRLFDGGIIEGYEKPCADVRLSVDYLPQITPGTYKATGRAYIKNFRYSLSSTSGQPFPDQVVYKDIQSGEYRWGGFCRATNGNNEAFTEAENYLQTLPLGGFVAYLAGTNFFGKTIQKFIGTQPTSFGLTVEASTGAISYDASNQNDRENMWDYLDYLFNVTNQCYQEFEISGVPNGRYVQRFTSHLTTGAELSSSSLNYQTRSTNAAIFANQHQHELEFVINNADFNLATLGDWILSDLCKITDGVEHFESLMGYLVDGNTLAVPVTPDEYMALPRIDLARAEGDNGPSATDHNGYFFSTQNISVGFVASGALIANVSSSINLITGAGWVAVPNGTGAIGVFRFNDGNLKQNSRTHFTGMVVDPSGNGVADIAVINTRGQWDITDANGNFDIIGYADTTVNYPSTTRIDKLIFSTIESICLFSFSVDHIDYNITIDNSGNTGTYNDFNTNHKWYLATPNNIATLLLSDLSISAFGRGVDIPIGIEYLDDGDRVCAVSFIENLHIKWYNETTNKGRPVVSWSIFHEPPSYAKKYKLMRGLSSLQNQLMWDINKVEAVDVDFTTVVGTNPKFWRLNFDNIAFYVNNQHPQANISFTYQKGDRVRFVKDGGNNYYGVYYDVEIVRVDNNDVWIEYDAALFNTGAANNTLVQLYTPRGTTQTRVFFECGETYAVKSKIFNGIRKYYHAGQAANGSQDQSYGPLPLQIITPATGTFKTGDQYYRLREIPVGVVIATPISTGNKIEYIYDQAISDFYSSTDQSIGRTNTDSITIGRIERPTTVRFTDRYIPGSKINGLCAFQPLNEKQFSTEYGLMMKLKNTSNDVLKAVFYNSFQVSMYINKGVLRQVTGATELVAISDDIIPRTNKLQRTYGTQNPESVQLDDEGNLFGWDENQGVKWRSLDNGIISVSDYGTNTYHRDISDARLALNRKKSQVPSIYDIYYDEYIGLFNSLDPDPGEAPSLVVCLPDIDLAAIALLAPTAALLVATYNVNGTPIPLFSISKNDFANYTDFSELVKYAINQHVNESVTNFTAETDDDGCVVIKTPNDSALYGGLAIQFDLSYVDAGIVKHKFFVYNFSKGAPIGIYQTRFEQDSIAFCKFTGKNGWTSHYDFIGLEMFGRIRNDIVSFKNGELWLHDQLGSPEYNVFYGVFQPPKMRFVVNKEFERVKVWNQITLDALSQWYIPVDGIFVPPTPQTPQGMKSELNALNFEQMEGKFYAALLNNVLTPNEASYDEALINGDVLRGQAMEVLLQNDDGDESVLNSASVGYMYSEP